MTTRKMSVLLTCEACGEGFHPIAGRAETQRYCNVACRNYACREPIRHMTSEERAWLAGLFDGEGHISVRVQLSQRAMGVKIQVTNTNRALLDEVKHVTGIGYITTRYRDSPRHKPTHDWHTTGANAKDLLAIMLPWLIEKRERALEAIG